MTPASVFLRSTLALLLGVLAFVALGYAFAAKGVRDTLSGPEPLLNALEKHHAYERVYDDGIISQQFEGTLRRLVGGLSIEPETEALLLKEILPPSEIKTATEQSVTSVAAFLNNESDTFEASIDIAAAIPRIKPTVFLHFDERIDEAVLVTVTSDPELPGAIEALTRDIAAGIISDSLPSLDEHPPDRVISALKQSAGLLSETTVRRAVSASLDRDERAMADALRDDDTRTALKLAARAIAGPVIDSAIENLREDLDDNDRFSAVDKIAQSVGSRHETMERFRFARTVLRLLAGGVAVLAIVVFLAAVAGIAGVFYPYPKHMVRWPGITLIVCGVMFIVIGLAVSSFVGVWESLWCPFVEVPSCNLTIDVASELLSDAANGMTLLSIVVTAIGILTIGAVRFVPAGPLRGKGSAIGHHEQSDQ